MISITEDWCEDGKGGCVSEDGAKSDGRGLDRRKVWVKYKESVNVPARTSKGSKHLQDLDLVQLRKEDWMLRRHSI